MITKLLPCGRRVNRGTVYRPSRLPEKPLVLWSFEGSPFCKVSELAVI